MRSPGDVARDPVLLEILWGRLVTILDEVDAATVRTAFSTVLAEGRDFACILLDAQARAIAQGTFSTTAFCVTLPRAAKELLKFMPPEGLSPGDTLATNDAWLGAGHLDDFSFVTPVFHRGRLVGYMGTVAHLTDVGGRLDYFHSADAYEEGVRLPPCRLFHKGVSNKTALDIIGANVRAPRLVLGDIEAIVATHQLGITRLSRLLDEYGLADLGEISDQILTRSAASMTRAIAEIPPGEYRGEYIADGYGDPITLRVKIRADGARLFVDYAGSPPQTRDAPINVVWNLTYACTLFALKCALIPELRNNEGLYAPIQVEAPRGSILNCTFPVAVQARTRASTHVHQVVFAALADAIPGRVQAGSSGSWPIEFRGYDADGDYYSMHFFCHGGKGATATGDGLSTTSFPYNAAHGSVEIYENVAPILVERKELRPDSGGPGRHRGGLGQEIVIRSRSSDIMFARPKPDKVRFPPIGLREGQAGMHGIFSVRGETPELPIAYNLTPGESVLLAPPGGGGFGNPLERDPATVAADVFEGYVTREAAARVYGVIVDDLGRVDEEATRRRREPAKPVLVPGVGGRRP